MTPTEVWLDRILGSDLVCIVLVPVFMLALYLWAATRRSR